MAIKTFTTGDVLTASDTNTYLANSGLVYITQTTFSGVVSTTVQSCFSGTYTNYVIVARLYTTSNDSFYQNTLGTTPAATNYNYQKLEVNGATITGTRSTGQTSFNFTSNSNGAFYQTTTLDLFSPYVADATGLQIAHTRTNGAYTAPNVFSIYGNHSTATSYDGFTISVPTGTMTGALWVYGRRNA